MQKETITKEIQRNILLNPGPATTSAQVKSSLVVEDICPREQEFGLLLDDIRKKLLLVANGEAEYEAILLGSSGTGAMESCLHSCLDQDDNKKILILENGAYGHRMNKICKSLAIKADMLSFGYDGPIDLQKVKEHLQKKKYSVMAFIHHETTTGMINPLEDLNRIAKKFNVAVMVDAMSSYGGIPIDLEKTDVDYLISSSNKCIQGMAGLGIVLAKKKELEKIKNYKNRSFYFNLYNNFLNQKETKQFLFTPPVQIVYSLNSALDEFFAEGGISARWERYSCLYKDMFQGMVQMGFAPLLPESYHSKILTTFLEPKCPNYNFDSMHDFLYKKGITIYPGKIDSRGTFRISNLGDLSQEDIAYFLSTVREYLNFHKIKFS